MQNNLHSVQYKHTYKQSSCTERMVNLLSVNRCCFYRCYRWFFFIADTLKCTQLAILSLSVPLLLCEVITKQAMLSEDCQEHTHGQKQRASVWPKDTNTLLSTHTHTQKQRAIKNPIKSNKKNTNIACLNLRKHIKNKTAANISLFVQKPATDDALLPPKSHTHLKQHSQLTDAEETKTLRRCPLLLYNSHTHTQHRIASCSKQTALLLSFCFRFPLFPAHTQLPQCVSPTRPPSPWSSQSPFSRRLPRWSESLYDRATLVEE